MKTVEYGKGNAKVIVLLHGGGLSWWNYEEAAKILAESYHVVLPILDGHAGSDAPFTTIEDNAKRVIAYISENFGGRVHLLGGLSLGGQIATGVLSQRSHICDFAVIESALACPMPVTAALVKPAFSLCYPLIKMRWFSRLQCWSLGIRMSLFEAYYRDTSCIEKVDLIAFMTANAAYRLRNTLAQCCAKTLVLVGGRERRIMKRSAHMISECLPSARLEVLKDLQHGELSINHGHRFAQMLLEWMQASDG